MGVGMRGRKEEGKDRQNIPYLCVASRLKNV